MIKWEVIESVLGSYAVQGLFKGKYMTIYVLNKSDADKLIQILETYEEAIVHNK